MLTEAKTREEFIAARRALLDREKALTRERDELAEARRALPAMRITKDYRFTGPDGEESLADLFAGRSQLIVYHFMFGTDWDEGCTSCSFWADNLDGIEAHLAHRDATFLLVSTAPYEKLAAYKKRMGWRTKWVSCTGSDFNRDLGVSFTPEELESGDYSYNFKPGGFSGPEAPGLSCFLTDGQAIWHTYSVYARGLDWFNGAYQLLDMAPKGRDEGGLDYTQAWLRRHDQYDD